MEIVHLLVKPAGTRLEPDYTDPTGQLATNLVFYRDMLRSVL